ncbi:unnamed protein product [Callosobruchus maculatus]|uniref:Peptidase C1A papain C-terminal domain-containing protein n=1 Tax=Callosobruchus maculatus TaxID=64391 RepID=A0A653CGV1_CALMS|nr:unnamed protein product [Callosobruchus maculatus]
MSIVIHNIYNVNEFHLSTNFLNIEYITATKPNTIHDRICIHSNGKDQVRISALDLSCCKQCSSKGLCKGGTIDEAFVYWAKTGIVTGGEVRRNQTDL